MLFNSISFLYFFVFTVAAYFLLKQKWRNLFLLLMSCAFYMAFVPKYILILGATIIIDYFAGIYLEKIRGPGRRLFLALSILANIGILVFFKYFNFLVFNFNAAANFLNWNYSINFLKIILPIGLSFHTFQALSYTIEVYKGRQKAEHNFITYALYVMFFPQLVAGPIERPQNLLHQFYEEHKFEYGRVVDGLKLMGWGFFKKIVIADRLAILVNTVYGNPHSHSGLALILATVFFSFQLYCDFSGYTDIARGAAQVLGFRLMENFNRPFFSKSISEFWRRWHISLSSWLRDYVYYPVAFGGSRGKYKIYLAVLVTFFVSGLWHGAGWTYVVWGSLYGAYIIISMWTKNLRERFWQKLKVPADSFWKKFVQVFTTFSLVTFTSIFFRAQNLSDAGYIITHLFSNFKSAGLSGLNVTPAALGLSFVLILILIGVELAQRTGEIIGRLKSRPIYVRWLVYYAVLACLLFPVLNPRMHWFR